MINNSFTFPSIPNTADFVLNEQIQSLTNICDHIFLQNMNSFSMNFILRSKTSDKSVNINVFYIKKLNNLIISLVKDEKFYKVYHVFFIFLTHDFINRLTFIIFGKSIRFSKCKWILNDWLINSKTTIL